MEEKMSKYHMLWMYVQNSGKQQLMLSFDEIEKIAGYRWIILF